MKHALSELQPQTVWNNFYLLTQVPRPSKHEEAIQEFMLNFGKNLGLESFRDDIKNVIIRKPATPGNEKFRGVILQSHLDMVPQANNDNVHDFTTDPINAYVDGDWVTAKGTTLGADNGMGVAAIMSILEATDLSHGSIEALFTCDEETGMTGALGLKAGILNGDILLNLDSEDEKELYIGCAGGVDGTFTLPIHREAIEVSQDTSVPSPLKAYQITVKGLKGGHSGIDIIKQLGNANKLLARLLAASDDLGLRLSHFSGGNLRNAIPREAEATIVFDEQQLTTLQQRLAEFEQILRIEYGQLEPNVTFEISERNDVSVERQRVLTIDSASHFLTLLNACPNGVYRMSIDIDGLVETSSNLAIVSMNDDSVRFECLLRSSVDSARDELAKHIHSVFSLAGAASRYSGAYPGWQPNPKSTILTVMKKTGEELFGETPKLCSMHAGLECGILGVPYPHWDMISFGPTIRAPHSPDEKVHIASVTSFYDWLVATLAVIPEATAK